MKQIVAVRQAVEQGCATSHEVAAVTGLSTKHVSAYLSELAKYGRVVVIGHVRFPRARRLSNVYSVPTRLLLLSGLP